MASNVGIDASQRCAKQNALKFNALTGDGPGYFPSCRPVHETRKLCLHATGATAANPYHFSKPPRL